ncbi:hypothetical protein CCMSSC00406_0007882 [Pleurotus cornucopiae]|uniref:Uncharacterized protein n=1 Tax=Pleurotus cornucopiae TaxID=5321 RepID=A0ACB7J2V3_PLECO|nr:hypothetical protein CCMSSC00406_0007882 [Pleurotus cornucopiae]
MACKKQRQERAKNESKPSELAPAVAARDKPSADQGGEAGKGFTDETHGQDKGKRKERRKVTFDVQPAVVTIKTDVKAGSEEEWARSRKDNDSDMVFELEEGQASDSEESRPDLPLIEQPAPS